MKHIVVHGSAVFWTAKVDRSERVLKVKNTIDRLLDDPSDVTVFNGFLPSSRMRWDTPVLRYEGRDARGVAFFCHDVPEVTLCGAYIGMCLYAAEKALKEIGVKVHLHPGGCI